MAKNHLTFVPLKNGPALKDTAGNAPTNKGFDFKKSVDDFIEHSRKPSDVPAGVNGEAEADIALMVLAISAGPSQKISEKQVYIPVSSSKSMGKLELVASFNLKCIFGLVNEAIALNERYFKKSTENEEERAAISNVLNQKHLARNLGFDPRLAPNWRLIATAELSPKKYNEVVAITAMRANPCTTRGFGERCIDDLDSAKRLLKSRVVSASDVYYLRLDIAMSLFDCFRQDCEKDSLVEVDRYFSYVEEIYDELPTLSFSYVYEIPDGNAPSRATDEVEIALMVAKSKSSPVFSMVKDLFVFMDPRFQKNLLRIFSSLVSASFPNNVEFDEKTTNILRNIASSAKCEELLKASGSRDRIKLSNENLVILFQLFVAPAFCSDPLLPVKALRIDNRSLIAKKRKASRGAAQYVLSLLSPKSCDGLPTETETNFFYCHSQLPKIAEGYVPRTVFFLRGSKDTEFSSGILEANAMKTSHILSDADFVYGKEGQIVSLSTQLKNRGKLYLRVSDLLKVRDFFQPNDRVAIDVLLAGFSEQYGRGKYVTSLNLLRARDGMLYLPLDRDMLDYDEDACVQYELRNVKDTNTQFLGFSNGRLTFQSYNSCIADYGELKPFELKLNQQKFCMRGFRLDDKLYVSLRDVLMSGDIDAIPHVEDLAEYWLKFLASNKRANKNCIVMRTSHNNKYFLPYEERFDGLKQLLWQDAYVRKDQDDPFGLLAFSKGEESEEFVSTCPKDAELIAELGGYKLYVLDCDVVKDDGDTKYLSLDELSMAKYQQGEQILFPEIYDALNAIAYSE